MSNGKRDYKKEDKWDKAHTAPNGVSRAKARSMRNKARSMVKAKVGAAAIKGKDIGHKKAVGRGGQSVLANLFVQNPGENRSFRRNAKGAMTSERSKRESKK